jgi:hypothetical protein
MYDDAQIDELKEKLGPFWMLEREAKRIKHTCPAPVIIEGEE